MRSHLRLSFRTAGSIVALALLTACSDQLTEPGTTQISAGAPPSEVEIKKADLGEQLFNDRRLSIRQNQSCASCHDQRFGWTAGHSFVNLNGAVMPGSLGRFGNRRPMSTAYTATTPVMFFDVEEDNWVGGMFWDGRATGKVLGSPAAEQAMGPFLNPDEMALPDKACVVHSVKSGSYATLYKAVWGSRIAQINFPASITGLCRREGTTVPLSPVDRAAVDSQYINIAFSIAAFENSEKVNPFNSRYDRSLAGREQLTAQEREGLALFTGKANCSACHTAGERAMFSTFEHYNTGVPANPLNPATRAGGFVDLALGATLDDRRRDGEQKIPTVRNAAKRPSVFEFKAYMHNGVFKTLEQVVHFYNTRDVLPTCKGAVYPTDPSFGTRCWPAPEVTRNVERVETGNLGLSSREEAAIVAFLKTLSDR